MLVIRQDDLSGDATRALLTLHLSGMHQNSPPGHVFALDLSGLQAPNVTVWTAWDGDSIAGIGALKELGDGTAEVKSMRTHPAHLRKGVGAALRRPAIWSRSRAHDPEKWGTGFRKRSCANKIRPPLATMKSGDANACHT